MSKIFSVDGKVALVTGASRGLGRRMAQVLAEHGATVVLSARKAADLKAQADAIAKAGGKADFVAFDVTDEKAAAAAIPEIVKRHGKLDILVNNAGIVHRQLLIETSTADWQRVIDTNLTACFVLAREAAKAMMARKYGRIVNLASVMAIVARPSVGAYVAAKHAVVGLTKGLAAELGPHVTVNSIAPGYMRTDITAVLQDNAAFNTMLEQRTAARRWGKPEDLDGALMLLASDASGYITGQTLVVDGGMTTIFSGP